MGFHASVEAVLDREGALPFFGRFRAVHVLEQRLGVTPGERQRDDLRQRTRFGRRDALGTGHRGPARRGWIAGNDEVIGNRAPLDVALWPHGPSGKTLPFV